MCPNETKQADEVGFIDSLKLSLRLIKSSDDCFSMFVQSPFSSRQNFQQESIFGQWIRILLRGRVEPLRVNEEQY